MGTNSKVNKYPYVILGFIHLIMLFYTLYKSRDKKRHIVLLMNYIGFSYIFEYIVVALFNGYVYKPKFLRNKVLDNYFGVIFSQFFYVPITALFITVFQLGWKSKVIFSLYLILIERVFIYLRVYKNHWWKTTYTFILILVSFFLNDKWLKLLKEKNPIIMFISFFNVIQVRWMNTIYIFAVLRKIGYKQGRFNSWEEHFRIAPAIGLSISLLLAWWAKAKNTVSKGRLFLSMAIVDYILIKKGFLKVKNYFVLPLIYFILIFTLGYSKRWVYESSELK